MKITAEIAGHRNGDEITVPVSLGDDDRLQFDVPTVKRANACSFAVDLGELREAITHLTARTLEER